jgi:hypothetical protein
VTALPFAADFATQSDTIRMIFGLVPLGSVTDCG